MYIVVMTLLEYIEQSGISQREVADGCGLSPAAVCRIIKGQRFPSPETLYRIHQFTDGKVGPDDFFRQRVSEMD